MRLCYRFECQNEVVAKDKRTKYCSKSCSATVNNLAREYKNSCKTCGIPVTYNRKFCSRKCISRYGLVDWIDGKVPCEDKNGKLSARARNYLLEKSNYKCGSTTCAVPGGWGVPNPVLGKPILTVDHIDGNWKNNYIENLIVLCYNCHTLTVTFGALNKGSLSGTRPGGLSRRR